MIQRTLAALALGSTLLFLFPDSPSTLNAQEMQHASPDLIDRYRKTLATDQGNLTLHYLLGVALLQDQQNAAALTELQTAYPAYQESIEAHYNLAVAALRLNDLDSAEIYLEQSLVLGAGKLPGIFPIANLYFNMALKSRELGDANEAIRYFHKVLSLAPQRYDVYRQLGDLYAHHNETELAIQSFHNYLKQFPDDSVSREYLFALEFNRGQDLLAAEEWAKAATSFKRALEIQQESPTALYFLGYISYIEQQPELAALHLKRALALADDSLQATIRPLLYNTALALRKQAKLSVALDIADQLANRQNAQFQELFLAGTLNLDLGNHRAADKHLRRAVKLDPANQGAQQNLLAAELGAFSEWMTTGKVKLAQNKLDQAEAALQQAAALQPQNVEVTALRESIEQSRSEKASSYFSSARAALDAADMDTALARLEQGLSIQPESQDGLALRDEINTTMLMGLDKLSQEAARAVDEKKWLEAEGLYQRVLVIAPQHQAAKAGMAQLSGIRQRHAAQLLSSGQEALNAGRAGEAIILFNKLLKLEPGNQQAREGLDFAKQAKANRLAEFLLNGRKALGRNNYREARQWFNSALELDDTSKAREELAHLEELAIEQANRLSTQAEQAIQQARYKEAKQLFSKALKLAPNHAQALAGNKSLAEKIRAAVQRNLSKGKNALQRSDNTAAMTAFRRVLDIAPDNQAALDGLGTSRENQVKELNQLVKQGYLALESGELFEAERLLTAALKQDAYHEKAQQLRQRLNQVQQSGAKPGDEQKLYLQGVSYYTQGKYAEAIQSWETVLLLEPGNEKAKLNIEKTKRKQRQIKEYSGG